MFLNARYMDPQLGMFLQPDWWEVTAAGVGTNRYANAGGDLVTGRGPGGGSERGRSLQSIIFGTCGKPFHYMNV